MGVEVNKILCETSHGKICLSIWDTAGQERYGGLREGYYISAHAGILMFDLTEQQSYGQLTSNLKSFTRICDNAPMIVVGNKSDRATE